MLLPSFVSLPEWPSFSTQSAQSSGRWRQTQTNGAREGGEGEEEEVGGLGLVKHTRRRAVVMSLVCVAHFIFMANDKPSGAKQMTNTSVTLIETISPPPPPRQKPAPWFVCFMFVYCRKGAENAASLVGGRRGDRTRRCSVQKSFPKERRHSGGEKKKKEWMTFLHILQVDFILSPNLFQMALGRLLHWRLIAHISI